MAYGPQLMTVWTRVAKSNMSSKSGRSLKRSKGAHEDGGGGEVAGDIWLEKAPWSSDSTLPGSFTLGQARGVGTRSYSSSWEEAAGS